MGNVLDNEIPGKSSELFSIVLLCNSIVPVQSWRVPVERLVLSFETWEISLISSSGLVPGGA